MLEGHEDILVWLLLYRLSLNWLLNWQVYSVFARPFVSSFTVRLSGYQELDFNETFF